MAEYVLQPMTSSNKDGLHQKAVQWMNAVPVTRKEYDELFLAITRLTDRIEALEKS